MTSTNEHDTPALLDELEQLRHRVAELEREVQTHRRDREVLDRTEKQNRLIMQSMLGGLVWIGLDGSINSANAEAERILGLAFEELNSRYVPDFGTVTIREDGSPFPVEEYPVSICLRTGQPQSPVLIGIKHLAGHTIWAVYGAAPLIDSHSGNLKGAVVNFIDVTELLEARKELHRTSEILRQIHDAVIEVDLQGVVRYWNQGAERLYGYTSEEARGQHISFIYPPDDRDKLQRDVIGPLMVKGEHELELVVWPKNQIPVRIHLSLSLRRDDHGKPQGMIGYSIDISDRYRAQQNALASQQWLESLVNTVDGIVWEADAATFNFTFVSEKAVSLLGYPIEEWLKADFWMQKLHPEDRDLAARFCLQAVRDGRDHQFEYRLMAANGKPVWLRDIVTLVRDGDRVTKLRGIMVDIGDEKQYQLALQHNAEQHRLMLSELDHRVRNNLASLAALIDISRRKSQTVADLASSIRSRVMAMSAVHSLLSRARWHAVSLRSLIHALVPIELHDALRLDGPHLLIAPRQVTALGMVLQELIANSLKYGALESATGSVQVSWNLDGSGVETSGCLRLQWHEIGGPIIHTQPQSGQGTELILGLTRSELRGRAILSYPAEGACHRFEIVLDDVGEQGLAPFTQGEDVPRHAI